MKLRYALMSVFAVMCMAGVARAAENMVVSDAYTYPTLKGTNAAAIFLSIENKSNASVVIINVASDAAAMVELHDHVMKGSVMKMEQVPSVTIPAKETLAFAPAGLHIMFMELVKPLNEGDTVNVTFTTKDGASIPFKATVKPRP